jgi:hypothetical protein
VRILLWNVLKIFFIAVWLKIVKNAVDVYVVIIEPIKN